MVEAANQVQKKVEQFKNRPYQLFLALWKDGLEFFFFTLLFCRALRISYYHSSPDLRVYRSSCLGFPLRKSFIERPLKHATVCAAD